MIEFPPLRSASKEEKERKTSSPSKPRSSRPRTAPLSGNRPKIAKQSFHHFRNLSTGPRKSTSRSESARPGSSPAKEANKDKTDSKETKTSTGETETFSFSKNLLILRDIDFVEFKLFWGRGQLGLKYLADCCSKIAQSGTPGPSKLASSIVR